MTWDEWVAQARFDQSAGLGVAAILAVLILAIVIEMRDFTMAVPGQIAEKKKAVWLVGIALVILLGVFVLYAAVQPSGQMAVSAWVLAIAGVTGLVSLLLALIVLRTQLTEKLRRDELERREQISEATKSRRWWRRR